MVETMEGVAREVMALHGTWWKTMEREALEVMAPTPYDHDLATCDSYQSHNVRHAPESQPESQLDDAYGALNAEGIECHTS